MSLSAGGAAAGAAATGGKKKGKSAADAARQKQLVLDDQAWATENSESLFSAPEGMSRALALTMLPDVDADGDPSPSVRQLFAAMFPASTASPTAPNQSQLAAAGDANGAALLPFPGEGPGNLPDMSALVSQWSDEFRTATAPATRLGFPRNSLAASSLYGRALVQARLLAAIARNVQRNSEKQRAASTPAEDAAMADDAEEYVEVEYPSTASAPAVDPGNPGGFGFGATPAFGTVVPPGGGVPVSDAGKSPGEKVPASVRLGVLSIFPIIEAIRGISQANGNSEEYDRLCSSMLQTVERVLGSLPPLALNNEPADCLDAFQDFVSSVAVGNAGDSQAVSALASLAIARGNARDVLGLAQLLFKVWHSSTGEAAAANSAPRFRIGAALAPIINFQREKDVPLPSHKYRSASVSILDVLLDPLVEDVSARAPHNAFGNPGGVAVPFGGSPAGGKGDKKPKLKKQQDACATDGRFFYLHTTRRGMKKIGTGLQGSIAGHVYARNSGVFARLSRGRDLLCLDGDVWMAFTGSNSSAAKSVAPVRTSSENLDDDVPSSPAPETIMEDVSGAQLDGASSGAGVLRPSTEKGSRHTAISLFSISRDDLSPAKEPRQLLIDAAVPNSRVHVAYNGRDIVVLSHRVPKADDTDGSASASSSSADKFANAVLFADVFPTSALSDGAELSPPAEHVQLDTPKNPDPGDSSASDGGAPSGSSLNRELDEFQWNFSTCYAAGDQLVLLVPQPRSEYGGGSKSFSFRRALVFDLPSGKRVFDGLLEYPNQGYDAFAYDFSHDTLWSHSNDEFRGFCNPGPGVIDIERTHEGILRSLFSPAPKPGDTGPAMHTSTSRFRVPVSLPADSAHIALLASLDRLARRHPIYGSSFAPSHSFSSQDESYCVDPSRLTFDALASLLDLLSSPSANHSPNQRDYSLVALLRVLKVNLFELARRLKKSNSDKDVREDLEAAQVVTRGRVKEILLEFVERQEGVVAEHAKAAFCVGFSVLFESDAAQLSFVCDLIPGNGVDFSSFLNSLLRQLCEGPREVLYQPKGQVLMNFLLDREMSRVPELVDSSESSSPTLQLFSLLQCNILAGVWGQDVAHKYVVDSLNRCSELLKALRVSKKIEAESFVIALKYSVVGRILDSVVPALLSASEELDVDGRSNVFEAILGMLNILQGVNSSLGSTISNADQAYMKKQGAALLRACNSGSSLSAENIPVEFLHPYVPAEAKKLRKTVSFPGAKGLCLLFDPRSQLDRDQLQVYASPNPSSDMVNHGGSQMTYFQYQGGNFPSGEAIIIPGDSVTFVLRIRSREPNGGGGFSFGEQSSDKQKPWGVRVRVSVLTPTDEYRDLFPSAAWLLDAQVGLTTAASTLAAAASSAVSRSLPVDRAVNEWLDSGLFANGLLEQPVLPIEETSPVFRWHREKGRRQPLRGNPKSLEWIAKVERYFVSAALHHCGVSRDVLNCFSEPIEKVDATLEREFGSEMVNLLGLIAQESIQVATTAQQYIQHEVRWRGLKSGQGGLDSDEVVQHSRESFVAALRAETTDTVVALCRYKQLVGALDLDEEGRFDALWHQFQQDLPSSVPVGADAEMAAVDVSVQEAACQPMIDRLALLLSIETGSTETVASEESGSKPGNLFWSHNAWQAQNAGRNERLSETALTRIARFSRGDSVPDPTELSLGLADRQKEAKQRAAALRSLSRIIQSESQFACCRHALLSSLPKLFLPGSHFSDGIAGCGADALEELRKEAFSLVNDVVVNALRRRVESQSRDISLTVEALCSLPVLGMAFSASDIESLDIPNLLSSLRSLMLSDLDSTLTKWSSISFRIMAARSHVSPQITSLALPVIADLLQDMDRASSSSPLRSFAPEMLSLLAILTTHSSGLESSKISPLLVKWIKSPETAPRARTLALRLASRLSSSNSNNAMGDLLRYVLDYVGNVVTASADPRSGVDASSLISPTTKSSGGMGDSDVCVRLREWPLPANRLAEVINSCQKERNQGSQGISLSLVRTILSDVGTFGDAVIAVTTQEGGKLLASSVARLGGTARVEPLSAFADYLLSSGPSAVPDSGKMEVDSDVGNAASSARVEDPVVTLRSMSNRNLQRKLEGGSSAHWISGATARALAAEFVAFVRSLIFSGSPEVQTLLTESLTRAPGNLSNLRALLDGQGGESGSVLTESLKSAAALAVCGGFLDDRIRAGCSVVVAESEGSGTRFADGLVVDHQVGAAKVDIRIRNTREVRRVPLHSLRLSSLSGSHGNAAAKIVSADIIRALVSMESRKSDVNSPDMRSQSPRASYWRVSAALESLAMKSLSWIVNEPGTQDVVRKCVPELWEALSHAENSPRVESRLHSSDTAIVDACHALWDCSSKPLRPDSYVVPVKELLPKSPFSALADETNSVLPSRWRAQRAPGMFFSGDLTVQNVGFEVPSGRRPPRSLPMTEFVILSDAPVFPAHIPEYYFEVTIDAAESSVLMSVGLTASAPGDRTSGDPGAQRMMPPIQWGPGSFRFQANARKTSFAGGNRKTSDYGTPFRAKSVVGCGFRAKEKTIYFTLDGNELGAAFSDVKFPSMLFPSLGLSKGVTATVNFGQEPFKFSGLRDMKEETAEQKEERLERERKAAEEAANAEKARKIELLLPLTSMGFPVRQSKIALLQTGNTSSDAAVNWLMEHGDFDFNSIEVSDDEEEPDKPADEDSIVIDAGPKPDEEMSKPGDLPEEKDSLISRYSIEYSSSCYSGDAFSFVDPLPSEDSGPKLSNEWEDSIIPAIQSFMEQDNYSKFEMDEYLVQIRNALAAANEQLARSIINELLGGHGAIQFPESASEDGEVQEASSKVSLDSIRRGQWVRAPELDGISLSAGDNDDDRRDEKQQNSRLHADLLRVWVPDMAGASGRVGRVRAVDFRAELVLLQFYDESSMLADWWFPLSELDIPDYATLITDSSRSASSSGLSESGSDSASDRSFLLASTGTSIPISEPENTALCGLFEEHARVLRRSVMLELAARFPVSRIDPTHPKSWVPLLTSQHIHSTWLPGQVDDGADSDAQVVLHRIRNQALEALFEQNLDPVALVSSLTDEAMSLLEHLFDEGPGRADGDPKENLVRSLRLEVGAPSDEIQHISLPAARSLTIMFEQVVVPPGSRACVEFFADAACSRLLRRYGENADAAGDQVNPSTNFASWLPFVVPANEVFVRMTCAAAHRHACRYNLAVSSCEPALELGLWLGEFVSDIIFESSSRLSVRDFSAAYSRWTSWCIDTIYSLTMPGAFKTAVIYMLIRFIALSRSFEITSHFSDLARLSKVADEMSFLYEKERKRGGLRPANTMTGQDVGNREFLPLHSLYLQALVELFCEVAESGGIPDKIPAAPGAPSLIDPALSDESEVARDANALNVAVVLAESLKQSESGGESQPVSTELPNPSSESRDTVAVHTDIEEQAGPSERIATADAAMEEPAGDAESSSSGEDEDDDELAAALALSMSASDGAAAEGTAAALASSMVADEDEASDYSGSEEEDLAAALALSMSTDGVPPAKPPADGEAHASPKPILNTSSSGVDADASMELFSALTSALSKSSEQKLESSKIEVKDDDDDSPDDIPTINTDEHNSWEWFEDFLELRQLLQNEAGRLTVPQSQALSHRVMDSCWDTLLCCTRSHVGDDADTLPGQSKSTIPVPKGGDLSEIGWGGDMSRIAAETALENSASGTFILRWSVNVSSYVISYVLDGSKKIQHIDGIKPVGADSDKVNVTMENGTQWNDVTVFEFIKNFREKEKAISEPCKNLPSAGETLGAEVFKRLAADAEDTETGIGNLASTLVLLENLPLVSAEHADRIRLHLVSLADEHASVVRGPEGCYVPTHDGKLKGFAVIRLIRPNSAEQVAKALHRHRLSAAALPDLVPEEVANLRNSLRSSTTLPRGVLKVTAMTEVVISAFTPVKGDVSSVRADAKLVSYLLSLLLVAGAPEQARAVTAEHLTDEFASVLRAIFAQFCSADNLLCEEEMSALQMVSNGNKLTANQVSYALRTFPSAVSATQPAKKGLTEDGFLLLYARQSADAPIETFDEIMRLGFDLTLRPLRFPFFDAEASAAALARTGSSDSPKWPAGARGRQADSELLDLAEEIFHSSRATDSTELPPTMIVVSSAETYPVLSSLPLGLVRARWCVILRLNDLAALPCGLPLVGMAPARLQDPFACANWLARHGRFVLLHGVKMAFANAIMALTACLPGIEQPVVTIDRVGLAEQGEGLSDESIVARSHFGHAFSDVFSMGAASSPFSFVDPVEGAAFAFSPATEVSGSSHDVAYARSLQALAVRQPRPLGTDPHFSFKLVFQNENVQGEGGPYRQFFTDVSRELQGSLSLFVPVPNAQAGDGDHREKWTLASCSSSFLHRDALTFLGWLFGACLRTGVLLSLDLPDFFWRPLALEDHRPSADDLKAIDKHFFRRLEFAKESPSDLEGMMSSDGVTEVGACESVQEALTARLSEHAVQIGALRHGLQDIVPRALLDTVCTGRDLAWRIAGRPGVDVEMLRRHTQYQGVTPSAPHVAFFWQVLSEFSTAERRSFLRFAWAQERLPVSDEEFERTRTKFVIKPFSGLSDPDGAFPKADTCFFHLQLPEYSSLEVMRARLLTAVTLDSHSMNADAEAEDELTTVDESRSRRRYDDGDSDEESDSSSEEE